MHLINRPAAFSISRKSSLLFRGFSSFSHIFLSRYVITEGSYMSIANMIYIFFSLNNEDNRRSQYSFSFWKDFIPTD